MDLNLKGDTALITGAASGIGLATARVFAEEGCSLLLWDCSPTVKRVAEDLAKDFPVDVTGAVVDIVDGKSVQRTLQDSLDRGASFEHVIHCAAVGSTKFGFPFMNLTPADWSRTLEVNIMGMVNVAHGVTPHLVQSKGGTIVFLSSVAGQIGSQTDPPYSASKAANINFAQCMAKDLATHGIRVNTVCPGMVQTALNRSVWQAWHDQSPEADRLSYEEWAGARFRRSYRSDVGRLRKTLLR